MPRDADPSHAAVPTRDAGLTRLADFIPNSGSKYASTRNYDFGPGARDNVSVLSPYIRHRLVLETEVLDRVLGKFAASTAEKFIQEVFWRTYFKGWLEQRPTVWTAYREDLDHHLSVLEKDGALKARYLAAVSGETGIDCFDAWAKELVDCGYLHNHTRMWFASIWIFTLELPWELGADVFLRHLMDGDPASNTLSWRWVGGLHTKGKTYLARPDNIAKYTDGRFRPDNLATRAEPLHEDRQHGKKPIPEAAAALPEGPSLLLITEEDCSVEVMFEAAGDRFAGGLAVSAVEGRSPLDAGEAALAFTAGALKDAGARVEAALDVAVDVQGETDDWAGQIKAACAKAGTKSVVTAYCPVGPAADRIAAARTALAGDDIAITEVRRPLDDIAWPHATRGYFALKTKIPDILEDLAREVQPRLL